MGCLFYLYHEKGNSSRIEGEGKATDEKARPKVIYAININIKYCDIDIDIAIDINILYICILAWSNGALRDDDNGSEIDSNNDIDSGRTVSTPSRRGLDAARVPTGRNEASLG
jgi:hypothetical protein